MKDNNELLAKLQQSERYGLKLDEYFIHYNGV